MEYYLLEIHYFASFAMFGLIWTIHIVHYPSFSYISNKNFTEFHSFHTKRITFIVLPLMVTELLTGLLLLWLNLESYLYWLLMILTLITWLLTFTLSVPLHQKLSSGSNQVIIQKLIRTNLPRTLIWTLKALILLIMNLN